MIKVHVLQVDTDPANLQELEEAIAAGHTDEDGWQMPKHAERGDLVVWYAAGRQQFVACGWVDAAPVKVVERHGPYRGQVTGMRWIEPADRMKVMKESGVNGGIQGYQTVKDDLAVAFLQSLGLFA